jgi:aminoglycoside phosphotransferase (APT) family kinase protein
MNCITEVNGYPVRTPELRAALEGVLGRHFGAEQRIAKLTRRPSQYQSSFAMDELNVHLADGRRLALMFKNLSRDALLEGARHAKPLFLHDPLREIEVYRKVLSVPRLGTPLCYGAVVDELLGRYWLFLERVPGLRLAHVGEFATWQDVARYLAQVHNALARSGQGRPGRPARRWLNYDRDFYWQWMRRARTYVRPGATRQGKEGWRGIDRLARRYERVVERLLAMPARLIHGEFYAANVLVHQANGHVRICPVDWEMAAVGPALIDLAALTCGTWTDEQRRALALAYHGALEPDDKGPPDRDAFLADLDVCQLHLAVQWLGWSLRWSAPPQQAWNWLSEALRLTKKLGV